MRMSVALYKSGKVKDIQIDENDLNLLQSQEKDFPNQIM